MSKENKTSTEKINKLSKPVFPNLQFGSREYQHLQCEKRGIRLREF